MAKTLVYLEAKGDELKKISREMMTVARMLGESITGVISTGSDTALASAGKLGLGKLVNLAPEDSRLYAAEAFAAELAKLIEAEAPDYIIFGQTNLGRDLAARLAAATGIGYISDVTGIEPGEPPAFVKPLYAGKIIGKFRFKGEPPHILTIRPNIFSPAEAEGAEVSAETVQPDYSSARSVLTSIAEKAAGMIDLREATVIISGGRGIGEAANFQMLFDFADKVGAAVGASRAVVDEGWIEHAHQVGQTGKTVNPTLYIACGISGAIQHLAGMQTSKCIVAINTNESAPIFKVADYGIVGDCKEIVPLLLEEILKSRG
ncbi:electron transfer flavoprotein subunit alpha/FixB family protein [bacterium]|nr:electron transfer flavoprotein subunit alpha/FixB family protein [bacterium]